MRPVIALQCPVLGDWLGGGLGLQFEVAAYMFQPLGLRRWPVVVVVVGSTD